jgi:hypothetical protein
MKPPNTVHSSKHANTVQQESNTVKKKLTSMINSYIFVINYILKIYHRKISTFSEPPIEEADFQKIENLYEDLICGHNSKTNLKIRFLKVSTIFCGNAIFGLYRAKRSLQNMYSQRKFVSWNRSTRVSRFQKCKLTLVTKCT